MTFQLPEKDYFTRKELSEKWQCDLSLVDDYIESGMLREAFRSSMGAFSDLKKTLYYKCDEQSKLFKSYIDRDSFDLNVVDFLEQMGMEKPDYLGDDFVECPKFIYNNLNSAMIRKNVSLFGKHLPIYISVFLYLSGIGSDRYIPANPIHADSIGMKAAKLKYEESMNNYLVIPKEERDRFESLNSETVISEPERKDEQTKHFKAMYEFDQNTQSKFSIAGGKASAAIRDKAKNMALQFAEDTWADWKKDCTNSDCPIWGDTAGLILADIYAKPEAFDLTLESVPTIDTIKRWIRHLAPDEAVRKGRPKKR